MNFLNGRLVPSAEDTFLNGLQGGFVDAKGHCTDRTFTSKEYHWDFRRDRSRMRKRELKYSTTSLPTTSFSPLIVCLHNRILPFLHSVRWNMPGNKFESWFNLKQVKRRVWKEGLSVLLRSTSRSTKHAGLTRQLAWLMVFHSGSKYLEFVLAVSDIKENLATWGS